MCQLALIAVAVRGLVSLVGPTCGHGRTCSAGLPTTPVTMAKDVRRGILRLAASHWSDSFGDETADHNYTVQVDVFEYTNGT